MIVLDFITGILSAICNQELESKECIKGIIKKVCYFLLVIVAHALDTLIPTDGQFLLRTITIYFLVANDGLSILENVGECGVEYPQFLKNWLKQLKSEASKGQISRKPEETSKSPDEEGAGSNENGEQNENGSADAGQAQQTLDFTEANYKALFPCKEGGITKGYSSSHKGIDVGWIDEPNCDIVAIEDGVIVQAEHSSTGGERGEYCVIEHNDGKHKYWSGYLHLLTSSLLVRDGDKVTKGQVIGRRGNTGLSHGTHLHLYMSEPINISNGYTYNKMKAHCTFNPLDKLYKTQGANISADIEVR